MPVRAGGLRGGTPFGAVSTARAIGANVFARVTRARATNRATTTPPLPADTRKLPVNPMTQQPIPPRAQPGYYPGFATLSQQAFWDGATRRLILDRVQHTPPIRFFTPDEARLLQAVIDRMLPQDDRDAAHRIPIINVIDERLYTGRIDGYRFEDMPPDREAHQLGLQGIQAIAQQMFGKPFEELEPIEQDRVLLTIHDGKPPAGHDIWQKLPVVKYWTLLLQDCIEGYYEHPWSWDEIGFGGPSYPRGYMRLEHGRPEPWEVEEVRYAWQAPPSSLSGDFTPLGGKALLPHPETQTPGQEGTH